MVQARDAVEQRELGCFSEFNFSPHPFKARIPPFAPMHTDCNFCGAGSKDNKLIFDSDRRAAFLDMQKTLMCMRERSALQCHRRETSSDDSSTMSGVTRGLSL
jgi:hypothetical protein